MSHKYKEIDIDEIIVRQRTCKLVDIEVENDHTFFVSANKKDFVLTHNTSWPDIDCLDSDHIIDTPTGSRRLGDVQQGDFVYSSARNICKVLFTQTRQPTDDDILYCLFLQTGDGLLGSLLVTGKHRLVMSDDEFIHVRSILPGDVIKSSNKNCKIIGKQCIKNSAVTSLTDITVEGDSTFCVLPQFDKSSKDNETWWIGSHNSDAGDRDVLIDEARKLYGDDAVIPVSNFNTLKLKSLVKSISKFFEVPFEEVNAVTGPLQDEVMPHAKDDDQEKSVFVLKHDDCMKYSPKYKAFMEKYPDVEECVVDLMMQNASCGRHAGGVIIAAQDDIEKSMPLISVRGELQTPWTEGMNFRNLEDNGFLKFDFLGLTLLKDVENCISRILKKRGIKSPTFAQIRQFFDENLNCRFVKQDDPAVWKHVYHDGAFVGVFQFTACLVGDTQIMLSNGTQKRLDCINSGDSVVSFNTTTNLFESKNVSDFIDQGEKECIELTLENGKTITCTLDHKFFTDTRGWIEAKDLQDDDDIVSF